MPLASFSSVPGSWTTLDLLNHLWQSSVVALALLALILLCRRLPARTRLALGWMALAKFAIPLSLFAPLVAVLGGTPQAWLQPTTIVLPAPVSAFIAAPVAAPEIPFAPTEAIPAAGPASSSTTIQEVVPSIPAVVPKSAQGPSLGQILFSVWAAGAALLIAGLLIRRWRLHCALLDDGHPISLALKARLIAAAAQAGLHRLPRCIESRAGRGPCLAGLGSPVLVLPAGLEDQLTPAELDSVLLHELIHARRRDNLWNGLQLFAMALLWFNPVVWLVGRWIRIETEKSCDEEVLRITDNPEAYVEGILKVVRAALGVATPAAVGILTPPVVARIQNIFATRTRRNHPWLRFAVLACAPALIFLSGHAGSLAIAASASPSSAAAGGSGDPAPVVTPAPAPQAATPPLETRGGRTVIGGTFSNPSPANGGPPPAVVWSPNSTELARLIQPLLDRGDRDFARGERLFTEKECASCHAFGTRAQTFGPNLTGLGGRMPVPVLLDSILNPSAVVGDLYGTKEIRLKDGSTKRGRLVSSDATSISLVDYAFDIATKRTQWNGIPVVIRNTDIQSIGDSMRSIMPENLLRALGNEEIADLVAYLMSGGNRTHQMFRNARPPAGTQPGTSTAVVGGFVESTPGLSLTINGSTAQGRPIEPPATGWDGQTVFRGFVRTAAAPSAPPDQTAKQEPAGASGASGPLVYDMVNNRILDASSATTDPGATRRPSGLDPKTPADRGQQETISVDFPDESIRTLLLSVSELFGLNVVIPDGLAGRVSLRLREATWQQIFSAALSSSGYTYMVENNLVTVKAILPVAVTVTGQVQRPGPIAGESEKPLTLLQAVEKAGGLTRLGNQRRVMISRTGADGSRTQMQFDLDAVRSGQIADLPLENGDQITVTERVF